MSAEYDEFANLVSSIFGEIESQMLGNINDQAQQGIKRFALGLKRISPEIKHGEAIEIIAKALQFSSWRELNSSLSEISQDTDMHVDLLAPVVKCPLPPYEPPCPPMIDHLHDIADRIALMMGTSSEQVLDKVIAFAHEAPSWQDLLMRDPYTAGDCFEVDSNSDGKGKIVLTKVGDAAFHALWHEMTEMEDWLFTEQLNILLELVDSNPQLFPAWYRIFEIWGREYEKPAINITGLCEACHETMMDLLDQHDGPLDIEADGVKELCELASVFAPLMLELGMVEEAYSLARNIYYRDGDDPCNMRWPLAIAISSPEGAAYIIKEVALGILDDLAEDVEATDVDGTLCAGLVMLKHPQYGPSVALHSVLRANLITKGYMRQALELALNEIDDSENDALLSLQDSTQLLLKSMLGAMPGICIRLCKAMRSSEMAAAERTIFTLEMEREKFKTGTISYVEAQVMWMGEIISRATSLAPKVAQAFIEAE